MWLETYGQLGKIHDRRQNSSKGNGKVKGKKSGDEPWLSGFAPDVQARFAALGMKPLRPAVAAGLNELRATVVLIRNAARHNNMPGALDVVLSGARYLQCLEDKGGWVLPAF